MQQSPYIIAEIGQAHEGSLGIAHSYIDALATTGVHAVKFQTHIAAAESSPFEMFRVNFSYEDATRYDYWKRMEFTPEQWAGLKKHCEDKNVDFLSTPCSLKAVALLKQLDVKAYKIGSGDTSNMLMLSEIAKTGREIMLSSGMSSLQELDGAVGYLKERNAKFSVLQCTTAYPTNPGQWGLNVLQELKQRYQVPVGFSDHSGEIFACLAAASLGASILEFHVVFDKRMFGPDASSSLTLAQVAELVKGTHMITEAINNPVDKNDINAFRSLKQMFNKSLAVNADVAKGSIITTDILESKKPGDKGMPANLFETIIGRKVNRDIKKGDFINKEDISNE